MYAMNIQNDVIGLVLHENCKSKQATDFIAWPSRCHVRIYIFCICTCQYFFLKLLTLWIIIYKILSFWWEINMFFSSYICTFTKCLQWSECMILMSWMTWTQDKKYNVLKKSGDRKSTLSLKRMIEYIKFISSTSLPAGLLQYEITFTQLTQLVNTHTHTHIFISCTHITFEYL